MQTLEHALQIEALADDIELRRAAAKTLKGFCATYLAHHFPLIRSSAAHESKISVKRRSTGNASNAPADVRAAWRLDLMAVSDSAGLLDLRTIPWLRSLRPLQCDSHPGAVGGRPLGLGRDFPYPGVEHALQRFNANLRRALAPCLDADQRLDPRRMRQDK